MAEERKNEEKAEPTTGPAKGDFIAPPEVPDVDERADALPSQEEFWRPPTRFGSVPVEKEPLGWDRRRGFRKLFPQVMLPFQVVERVQFGHPDLDGAPGLVKAVKRMWPRAYRQRCQVHKMRNILAKLPRLMRAKVKGLVQQVFLAPTYAAAVKRGRDLIAKFQDRYPAALECLERDLEECVTALRFPEAHHQRIRTTNRLERLNGEGRRRTKVIPRFPTERSCLTLLYASLVTASKRWRGIPMTPAIMRQLQNLRTGTDASAAKEAVA